MSLLDLLPTVKLEHQNEVRKKVAISATIGLTVGAVAGVLLAPRAGKETRDDLAKTIHELPDKAKELSDRTHKVVAEATGKTTPGPDNNERLDMVEDILKGQWHELKGGVKAKWGKLTDEDISIVNGQAEKLMGMLQTKYGYSIDKAKEEYNNFIKANRK